MRFLLPTSALAVLLVLALGAGDVAASEPRVVTHGSRDDKVVALTFDDGWSIPRCQRILDILVTQNVPATFFPNALYVRRSPAFWQRVARLGFPIGNHTVNHRDLHELSSSAVFKEIDRNREIVEEITGVPMIRAMRPPFGSYDKRTLRQAAKAGFPTLLLWDTTANDTSRRASDRAMIRAALKGRSGSVVVLHCGPKATPRILPKIIEGYRARGFRFVTIPALLGIDGPTRGPHRPWAWSLAHRGSGHAAPAVSACPRRTLTAAAGQPRAGSSESRRRTGWSTRPTRSCSDPSSTGL
jgi:peptidoglycan/xylan/chitin deacetylase (PgdA/CDA1 family)